MTPLGFALKLYSEAGAGPVVSWCALQGGEIVKLRTPEPIAEGQQVSVSGRPYVVDQWLPLAEVWRLRAIEQ